MVSSSLMQSSFAGTSLQVEKKQARPAQVWPIQSMIALRPPPISLHLYSASTNTLSVLGQRSVVTQATFGGKAKQTQKSATKKGKQAFGQAKQAFGSAQKKTKKATKQTGGSGEFYGPSRPGFLGAYIRDNQFLLKCCCGQRFSL